MKIYADSYEILSSGELILPLVENIRFLIDSPSGFWVKCQFDSLEFSNKPLVITPRIYDDEKNTLYLHFSHVRGLIKQGNYHPLEVGTYKNKVLYLKYIISDTTAEKEKLLNFRRAFTDETKGGILFKYTWLLS